MSVVLFTALVEEGRGLPRLQPRQGSNVADFPPWYSQTRADPVSAMPLTGGAMIFTTLLERETYTPLGLN